MAAALDAVLDFRRRVAEAAAWCLPRAAPATVGDALWTPALRPAHWPPRPSYASLRAAYKLPWRQRGAYLDRQPWPLEVQAERRRPLVEALVAARAGLLAAGGTSPAAPAADLLGGRLLIFGPDATLSDGAAEQETAGFFDGDNTPAWDTWLAYVDEPIFPVQGDRGGHGYLVAWIPPTLLTIADAGIVVNPERCLRWAEAVDAPFLRRLREAGLLPR